MSDSLQDLTQWVGRTEEAQEILSASQLAGLSALLGEDGAGIEPGDKLKPTAHWLFFQPRAPQSEIGADGHPKRGGFLPPVELPRRMWAGTRIDYAEPLLVGETATRKSEILSVTEKNGAAGPLVFVTVRHTYIGARGVALVEEQDIVYREDPKPDAPKPKGKPAPENGVWAETATPDPVMLFRYSAVTFNGHRIHYDLPYANEVEGYPERVVHGPLTATLLIEAFKRNNKSLDVASYHYRSVSPLFCGETITFSGAPSDGEPGVFDVWAANAKGELSLSGKVTLRSFDDRHPQPNDRP